MKNMKTALGWFNEMPSPYREQAYANCPRYMLNLEHESAIDALFRAFTWSETKQGHKYWADFCKTLIKSSAEAQNIAIDSGGRGVGVADRLNASFRESGASKSEILDVIINEWLDDEQLEELTRFIGERFKK